jgi:C4-dicarboxylate-specific signal transduction histidine kinase
MGILMKKKPTYEELKKRVEHLEKQARQLRLAERDRLERERLQGVLEMAGAICHELNQPMQVLCSHCEQYLKTMVEDNALGRHLKGIVEKIDHMALIVRKLELIASYETKDYMEGKRIIDIDKASRAA